MSSSLSLLFNSSTTPFTNSLTIRSNRTCLFSDCLLFTIQPHPNPPLNIKPLSCSPLETRNTITFSGNNNNNNNHNNNNNGGWWSSGGGGDDGNTPSTLLLFLCFGLAQSQLGCALAKTPSNAPSDYEDDNGKDVVWEIRCGKWIKLLPNPFKDDFEIAGKSTSTLLTDNDLNGLAKKLLLHCKDLCVQLMLPNGYPHSVTGDYMEYSLWRGVQGVASQVSGVLATQALLYAVGLGKGAIPVAAAINWVLKDGIGYLSKILLSKYGRHFDVNPKGWRLFADLLENAAFGLEISTPAFPHLFVPIGAVAGAGRSAAALIQAATRSCFFAGFAAQRNFAEVIAKGEAQGMVSKFIGIMLGIALANCVGSSTPLSLATFTVVTGIHMFCNLKSYQAIILRTLNPYRASLVFSEYLLSGQVPQTKEVNDEEPLFPALPLLSAGLMGKGQPQLLSVEAKEAAVEIERRLQMGSKLSEIVNRKDDASALFDLYRDEGYILAEYGGRFCVVLKEGFSPQDMLKSMFHVNYLYWLEKNVGIETQSVADDCRVGGRLQVSLDYVQREFNHIKHDGNLAGWVMDGLIAQPLPYRIKPGYSVVSAPTT